MKFTILLISLSLALGLWSQTSPDINHSQMHPSEAGKGVATGGHMDRHFDDAEQWAKQFDDPKRDQWQMPEKVIAALKLKNGQKVADIGAGTGYFTVRLAKSSAKPNVFAVDIEASMVDYIKKRAAKDGLTNITAIQATPDSPKLPEPMDLIFIVDTYHHIPNREAYFRSLAASLKPRGQLAIIDWKLGGPMGPPDAFRFTPEQIVKELARSGFKSTKHHDFLPNQHFQIFTLK